MSSRSRKVAREAKYAGVDYAETSTTDVTIRTFRYDDPARFTYRCGWTRDGIAWSWNECEHDTPRQAIEHRDELKGSTS